MPTIEITSLALLGAAGWLWLDGLRAREAAVAAARRACEAGGLQFLDDSVARGAIRLERDDDGVLRLRRSYAFEFSVSGDDRRPGWVVVLGRRVVSIDLESIVRPGRRALH